MKLKISNGKVLSPKSGFAGPNDGDGDDGCGRKVVVVGVKLDKQSTQLLTWTLMKIAQPGDRVIALHVLQASSGTLPLPLSLFPGDEMSSPIFVTSG